MRYIITSFSTILCVLLLCTSAYSADRSGIYISLDGGAGLLNETNNSDGTGSYQTAFEKGLFAALTIGYNLGAYDTRERNGRIEIEGTYRSNDLKTMTFSNSKLSAEGTISATGIMINSIGEYRTYYNYAPYIGFGIGVTKVKLADASMAGNPVTNDDGVALAYQFLAGVSFPATSWLDINVGYRFFNTSGLEFTDSQGRNVDAEYNGHNASVGLRISF